jgi:hypothetical protein
MMAGTLGLATVAFGTRAAAVPPPNPGPGSFTTITSPSANLRLALNPTGPTQLTVSGVASSDISSVDIDCIATQALGDQYAFQLSNAVPVVSNSFSTKALVPKGQSTPCRLRAIPHGYSTTNTYLGSFAGPLLLPWQVTPSVSSTTTYGVTIADNESSGYVEEGDVGSCATEMVTVSQSSAQTFANVLDCALALTAQNDFAANATGSRIVVDGKNGYLPAAVHTYLIGSRGLPVLQPAVTYSSQHGGNGDLTLTETVPIERCTVGNDFPPTTTSCPGITATAVKLIRTVTIFRSGNQLRIRDNFISTDGKVHAIALAYENEVFPPTLGRIGVSFPKHAAAFALPAPNQSVTGFGRGAATMLIRSDTYAVTNDPQADTLGVTWSRAPSSVQFSKTSNALFSLNFALKVPARAGARIGFAVSQNQTTSQVKALGAQAVADMMATPAVRAPKAGARLSSHTVTVKGTVGLGANGLPTSVKVNGHAAKIARRATSISYVAHIRLPVGRHTISVVAHDAAGNISTRKITVRVT